MTIIAWLHRDFRRLGRQIWLMRDKAKEGRYTTLIITAILGITILVLSFGRPLWAVFLLLFVWSATLPSRLMIRPLWNLTTRYSGFKPPPRIVFFTVRHKPYGYQFKVYLRLGQNFDQLKSKVETIASGMDVSEIHLATIPNHKAMVKVNVLVRLPFKPEEIIRWPVMEKLDNVFN